MKISSVFSRELRAYYSLVVGQMNATFLKQVV